jgi:hypothetical protein
VALVAAGGGLVTTAVGGYVTLEGIALYRDADCNARNECSPAGLVTQDRGRDKVNAGGIVMGAGLVALATGVVLWLTASSPAKSRPPTARSVVQPRVWVSAVPTGETRSLTVMGTF